MARPAPLALFLLLLARARPGAPAAAERPTYTLGEK